MNFRGPGYWFQPQAALSSPVKEGTVMADDIPEDTASLADAAELTPETEIDGDGWSGADIEDAYRKALEAMEDIPWEETVSAAASSSLPGDRPPADMAAAGNSINPGDSASTDTNGSIAVAETSSTAEAPGSASDAAGDTSNLLPVAGPRLAGGTLPAERVFAGESVQVTPSQVIEAALFVGGGPLTAKRICALVRGSSDSAFVEQSIDELNDAYSAQGRPYEIRLGDGGYRLELRPEYDRLRHRVYGSGPREVRLSPDLLEVLALVAYQQPIRQLEIESHGKQNVGNLLRQLLRRDLVAFERGSGGRKDVRYHTTARFLSVFGLGSLEELPQAEDLAKK
jgi:chromosome segregation and condensation protein ScpB